MAIIGTLLKKGIHLRESLEQEYGSASELQKQELKKLLIAARKTHFGEKYQFRGILESFRQEGDAYYQAYAKKVPIYDYEKIYAEWWHLLQQGEKNITWPKAIKFFALSSGTSGASSKYIPISKDMVQAMRKTGVRQLLTLSKYDLPSKLFNKGILMLGGSTDLEFNGTYFAGDLSGITAGRLPIWFQRFYKPGQKIAKNKNWGEKLDQIVEKAAKWDIGIIVGVPAWLQILIEKIIAHYQVETIHDIWPNLTIFVHGGVCFEPYKRGFEKLLARPLIYMETYLASEGFLAFQASPECSSMKLVLNNGVFYEFIPFTDQFFDENGDLKEGVQPLSIAGLREGVEYAMLISTCAGAWRYMIGDVVKFTSLEECELIITGRTKHFLSLCGEHLSVDNMNKAIQMAENQLNIHIREFTVIGLPYQNLFAHQWYVGTDDAIDHEVLGQRIDDNLKQINDDYITERNHALKKVSVQVVPSRKFYDWMKSEGKEGGQHKFPRVLKGAKMDSWIAFLDQ
ncbi:hypothetical protein GCM10007049_20480 [Echinicola pacifica]|uniref:GH3 auxin-responsive promoter n=1 Tax=Echinicola pacifica TaxID=346377 RepID=A0A918PYS7_9BACT|nr:GH3 auxin-responsive promoter family protein [Echinicola pacifica]GGZ27547.1 hypothetical protein GCM10007049_20480 [Echinicola pacifica]